ncbi:hypothetical protein TNCV_4155411 [Trichonephila clavipes]|nr:hypothetical protein TNCV_4155411 [Trichonephila clavipes]
MSQVSNCSPEEEKSSPECKCTEQPPQWRVKASGSRTDAPKYGLEVSLQTDHLIGTSAHAPQRQMVMYPGMGTIGPGPHGLSQAPECLMATRAAPRCAVHYHALSLVKLNSARLRHFLLHTSVPFHEITPINIQQAKRKMLHINNVKTIVAEDLVIFNHSQVRGRHLNSSNSLHKFPHRARVNVIAGQVSRSIQLIQRIIVARSFAG